jgi:hypothetical protein
MTDTSSFIPNQKGVSSDLMYNLKASSVQARSYRASIPPTNAQTFAPGSTIIMYIPGGRSKTFLDCTQSYLRFTVQQNSATNDFHIDHSAGAFINRLDVFHSSNALESIQNYNVLHNAVTDIQCNVAQKIGLQNSFGFGNDTSGRNGLDVSGLNARQTFCIPILSGVVGVLLDKMLPLHALSDDIRLEFTLENSDLAVAWTGATSTPWKIINVELELQIIELGDEGMAMVNSVAPRNNSLFLHGNTFRHYTSTIPNGYSGSYSTLIPSRQASLKSLMVLPRRSTEIVDPTSYSLSSRVNPNIASYWWRVGSALVPQKPINLINQNTTGGFSEGYSEIQKAWHSLGHFEMASSLSYPYFNVADTSDALGGGVVAPSTTSNSYKNAFMIQTELESFANRTDVILSGMNTLSSQVFFECVINTPIAANYTLDIYSNFDHNLAIENGILSVKF